MTSLRFLYLKFLLKLHNILYHNISGTVVRINNGVHPKHRIMNYHNFFLENIEQGAKVLDIGCGIGAVAYSLSEKAEKVVACDYNPYTINTAKKLYSSNNIQYLTADATEFDFDEKFDYIILSNVLEHIQNRIEFLKKLKSLSNYMLIRIPMINRSWLTLYKKELGVEYRLDNSHYIEYTLEGFKEELRQANLELLKFSIQFGEIWARIKT